ncbi:glycerol acyltransferase [Hoylesella timonensis]|uniref:Glycerol acyltransferase n=1 Tax=Hoylesella timonensis TaxID=386414 RepID=A0A2N6Q4T0_9BACT|nr:glycerol acyltransferase [Hoylesella timonensis]PMC09418.1 glycerol acyltransferase [Hoylesella timonensis]
MHEEIEKTIDIDEILKNKLGDKVNYLPRFVASWLKKITHQDEINVFLWNHRHLTGTEWLEACIDFLDVTLEIQGEENLPDPHNGKLYTFVSNHPLGGADGVAIGAIIGRHYGNQFRYLLNDLLLNLPALKPVSIGINKTGKQGRNFPAMVEEGFQSDNHIIMFPAGLCSRKINGQIRDIPWKKTFISKSVEHHRDVVPIHFDGRNSDKFYLIAHLCKVFHLKVNLAMLFLVDEMFKNKHQTFHVKIGKPIPWQTFDKSKTPREWAQYVQNIVYQL